MIGLDVADLVVIASEVLGRDTGTALAQVDITAAEAALARAAAEAPGGVRSHPAEAAEAAIALVDALLRHPPFPAHREQAYIDVPRAAVIVIERLAAGQYTPAQAASWLAAHLFPDHGAPAGQGHRQATPPAGSPVAVIARVRRRYRRRIHHPSPFLIRIGPSVGDGLAVKALKRLGVGLEAVREQVQQVEPLTGQQPDYPSDPEAPQTRRVWHAVADEAFARGDDYIGTEHFLFALFCDDDNAAAQVLTGLGAGERAVRATVADLLAESGRERSA